MTVEQERSEPQTTHPRNLIVEISGAIVSMVIGAFLGLMTGGNGLGYVSFVVLCAFIGWIRWARRRQSLVVTLGLVCCS